MAARPETELAMGRGILAVLPPAPGVPLKRAPLPVLGAGVLDADPG